VSAVNEKKKGGSRRERERVETIKREGEMREAE